MPIASLTTTEAEISAMGNDVGEGHITAAPYFEGMESPHGDEFVNRYRRTYGEGERTNMCVEAAYFQVKLFAKALEQVNTLDPDVLRPVVLGTTVEAPQGPVTINPSCGHANVWSRVGRCTENGTFSVVYKSSSAVTADPFMIGMPRVA
jgi:branched-chain amino acid transport system substrate-binding protein